MPKGRTRKSDPDADAEALRGGEPYPESGASTPFRRVSLGQINDQMTTIMSGMSALQTAIENIRRETTSNIADLRVEISSKFGEASCAPLKQPEHAPYVPQPTLRTNMQIPASNEQTLPCMSKLAPVPSLSAAPPTSHTLPTIVQPTAQSAQFENVNRGMLYNMPERQQLFDLPKFDGNPEEWPLFKTSFIDSTREFNYANRHNLIRLNKALHGAAKSAVVSLLIFPDNVPQVLQELEFNFGRPDILVRSQIEKVNQIPAMSEARIDEVLALSNQLRNMVALFRSAGCEHHLMNGTLLDELVRKLPPSKQYEWARYAVCLPSFPTVDKFAEWLRELANVVSVMQTNAATSQRTSQTTRQQPEKPVSTSRRILHSSSNSTPSQTTSCLQCGQRHALEDCKTFVALSTDDKWKTVKTKHLCFSCLRRGHSLFSCRKKQRCSVNGCQRMHHKILHNNDIDSSRPIQSNSDAHVLNCRLNVEDVTLFKVVPVVLSGPSGSVKVYAMLDEGSSISLIEADVARKIGLNGQEFPLTLQWFGNERKTEQSRRVSVEIGGEYSPAPTFTLKGVHTIASLNLPAQTLRKEKYKHMSALPISNYYQVQPKILLGLDNAFLGVSEKVVENGCHQPIAIKTKLGWIAYGPSDQVSRADPTVLHITKTLSLKDINKLVNEYFSVESFGVRSTDIEMKSDEDRRAVKILEDTTKRIGDRYETGLLWRSDETHMPPSYDMAKNRLIKVEKRMSSDSQYAERYIGEINKYIEKGYARKLTMEEEKVGDHRTWYLPHFGVVNPNKPEKLRIVFDAAATTNNMSFNSALLKGPEHAQSLISILYKFREGVIAVAGDIQEMFSQVRIREADQSAQRFLWRDGNTDQPMQTYVMTSMIFGSICSPCCAEFIKNKNANEYKDIMPQGAAAVIRKTYVDDLVISFNDEKEAERVTMETVEINSKAGFKLRSFVSNCQKLQAKLNGCQPVNNIVNMDREHQTDKVLGLFWNTERDTLEFQLRFHKIPPDVLQLRRPPTKREMLGIIMAVYDPLGLLANYTIFSKLLLQASWKLQVEWDEPLPHQLFIQWSNWWKHFQYVKGFSVARCYTPLLPVAENVQLHVFVDASSSAYAAVVYLRVRKQQTVNVALVSAKSRCAPPKGMTIPRLELQAAILGCRLSESVQECHEFRPHRVIFWCDSKTVISWIRSTTREYKQFVACRIAEILSVSTPSQWCWLPTAMNVADEATRAKLPDDYDRDCRWIRGPEFLQQDEHLWPKETCPMESNQCRSEEITKRVLLLNDKGAFCIPYDNFSSYTRMLRCVAWMQRFVNNCKSTLTSRQMGELTAVEMSKAAIVICRQIQREKFVEEISHLRRNGCVPKDSSIYPLTPYICENDVLRVQGRIDAAYCLPLEARRPIILPKDHYVTRLIVEDYHQRRHHQNDHLVINEIRQKFWIPNARSLLKSVKRRCPSCIINNAKPAVPLMGQLPPDRLTPFVRPFSYTGVDYCGPFYVAIGRRREKRWVALFTCLTTRAVHLKIADELSTDAFLLCLRNFTNRRGTPIRIRSDNGTNFIGAQKELTPQNRLFDLHEIQRSLARDNIEWIFNCPANPNAGGCWERLVQCVKRLLSRTLKEEAPRLSTFRSVLIEAENIINSRPLTDLPMLPGQEEPLTPNHFLLGCLNSTQTPSQTEENVCLRKQWKIAQNMKDRIWKRWISEYLPQLLRRSKWQKEVTPLKIGQMVIICDNNLARSQWQKGVITRVFPAKDGQIRSAEVRTSQGLLRRPASKLAALIFETESSAQ